MSINCIFLGSPMHGLVFNLISAFDSLSTHSHHNYPLKSACLCSSTYYSQASLRSVHPYSHAVTHPSIHPLINLPACQSVYPSTLTFIGYQSLSYCYRLLIHRHVYKVLMCHKYNPPSDPPTHPSIHRFVHPFVCPSFYPIMCLSLSPSV